MWFPQLVDGLDFNLKDMVRATGTLIDSVIFEHTPALRGLDLV
jgi:hypothetical protein